MKNRTVIGVLCIVLAVVMTFVVTPLVSKAGDKKVETVQFSKDIVKNQKITDKDIELVKISSSALPEKAIKKEADVVGKYVVADVFKGDVATEAKLTDKLNTTDSIYESLKGDKVAMSIAINSFAGGMSGKLQSGDIVSIYVTDKKNETSIPPELKYVKVITTTTSGGVDENKVKVNEDGTYTMPSSITVLVNMEQAKKLANYDKTAKMHVALVYRGADDVGEKFLKSQDDFFKKEGN